MEINMDKQPDRDILDAMPEPVDVTELGEGLKLIKRDTANLDHAMASRIMGLPIFSPDRPLNSNKVAAYVAAMKRGTFMWEQVQIITCTLDGKEYRMNGQHTCTSRLEVPIGGNCQVTTLRYNARTDNDMRRLYASIDRGMAQNNSNIVCAYLYDTPEWKKFSKPLLRMLAEGLSTWLWEEKDSKKHDADERSYLLMTDHYNLGQKVGKFLQNSIGDNGRVIKRRPVIGAMFATFAKNAGSAVDFWSAVRDGTGFGNRSDARLTLRNYLMTSAIDTGLGAGEAKNSIKAEDMYRACLVAWNASVNSDTLKNLNRVPDERPRVASPQSLVQR